MNAVTEFRDPAELPQASFVDSPENHFLEGICPQCRHEVDAVCPECNSHIEPSGDKDLTERYRRLMLLLLDSRNAKFMLGCYLLATGDAFADGFTMTEFAKRWSVGKAVVSKHCRIICERLEIEPSRYMRTEETASKFRLANRRPIKGIT